MAALDRELLLQAEGVQAHCLARRQNRSELRRHDPPCRRRHQLTMNPNRPYVEFGFNGGVVANNLVDGASVGVSITNFNEGGRLATATGNVLRNLFRRPDPDTGAMGQGVGIAVEADAAVTGNVIEGAEFAGLSVGYGPYLRDVLVSGNVVP